MKGDSTYTALLNQCNDLMSSGEEVFGYEEYLNKIDSMKSSIYSYYSKERLSRNEMLTLINAVDCGCFLQICG